MKISKFLGALLEMLAFVCFFWLLITISEHLPRPWRTVVLLSAIPLAWLGSVIAAFYLDYLDQWLRKRAQTTVTQKHPSPD